MAEPQNPPEDRRYTSEHEWIKDEGGGVYLVGITAYAQQQLGDVVYVELPKPGTSIQQGNPFGVVESVKAASDLYAPVSGEVLAANDALQGSPEVVNQDPYGAGWMIRLRPSDASQLGQLLDHQQYAERVAQEDA